MLAVFIVVILLIFILVEKIEATVEVKSIFLDTASITLIKSIEQPVILFI